VRRGVLQALCCIIAMLHQLCIHTIKPQSQADFLALYVAT